MSEFISQFGDELIKPSESNAIVKPADALAGKEVIMLYFSAHWCPPCRRFTPKLIKLYQKLKDQSVSVELVFCSLDNKENDYKEYISDMPWLCTPFESQLSKKMATKYKAGGIPHLVVVDGLKDGKIITMNGTSEVGSDADGANFPWRPKTMSEIWPDQILASKEAAGDTIESDSLKDKYLMLYFSAHWCPPCKIFTPKLSKAYKKMKAERDDFELVFISSDRDEETFKEYFGEMTFCALPYSLRETKAELSNKFEVKGIPKLIIVGPVGDDGDRPLINENVRSFIEEETFDEFPFKEKPYGSIDSMDLNGQKSLVIFHENGDDDEQGEVKKVAKDVAAKVGDDINICWSLDGGGLGARIREVVGMSNTSEEAAMVILNIPDNGGYYKTEVTDITVETVMNFIESPGERLQLSRE